MPIILAHGALGPFDEIIFLGIAVVFLGMMGLSWLRSQQLEGDELDEDENPRAPESEHFELE
ncbi:MAG: hypothetical protein OXG78_13690 [Chloroflexi bacterium]|nr:hypothetical protein [Chloroflexota bacterium]